MATRPYWTGRLRLALVSIPVQLFPATRSAAKISFHQVHEPSGKRVRYQKVVPGIGPIDPDEIVKGYEVEKDKYVLLTDEEVDEVKLEAKKTVDLVQFVDQREIDPLYFDRPFFVLPDEDSEDAEEAYLVLRDALKRTKKIGLGQIVVRGKSSLIALKPCGRGLLVEMLRYADEVRKADSFFSEISEEEPAKELTDLAAELIERRAEKFEPEKFQDKYRVALQELIEAKLEKRAPREIEAPERGAQVIDLMQALKRSVRGGEEARAEKGGRRRRGGRSRAKSARPRRTAKRKAA